MVYLYNILTLSALVLLLVPLCCQCQCTEQAGCFPEPDNLAIGRDLLTNSSCSPGEEYCLFLDPANTCLSCTADNSAHLNDNDPSTAWVSNIGSSAGPAVLQFDFEAPLRFVSTRIEFESIRPQTMVLEVSRDQGSSWEVLRYYSTACQAMFGRDDVTFIAVNRVFENMEAICTSSQSQLFPFTGGEVMLTVCKVTHYSLTHTPFSHTPHPPPQPPTHTACNSDV